MRKPRLNQPLFTGKLAEAKQDGALYSFVRAYDCIWSLLYKPEDLSGEQVVSNARVNLDCLGTIIENAFGPDVFDIDPNQLTFPDEILDADHKIRF